MSAYQFHRSDVPALLFVLTPVVGLLLDAPAWWWAVAPTFWAIITVAMGYTVKQKRW